MKKLYIPNDFNSLIKYLKETLKSDEQRVNYLDELINYFEKNKLDESILSKQTLGNEKQYYQTITDSKLRNFLPLFNFNKYLIQRYSESLNTTKEKIDYLKYVIKEFEKRNVSFGYEKYKIEIAYFELELKHLTDLTIPEPKQDKPEESKPEPNNPEPKQVSKPLNKITFNSDITEENIVLLFNLLNQTGFISNKDFSNLGKILQDTFLNGKGKPFVNTQINKVKTTALNTKKLTEKKNINLLKLYSELKKLIPD